MLVAGQLWRFSRQEEVREMRMHERKRRIVERHLDLLAFTGFAALVHRHQDADDAIKAHRDVDHGQSEPRWPRLLRAIDTVMPCHGADDAVIARKSAERSVGAEARNLAVDELGEALFQRLIANTPRFH